MNLTNALPQPQAIAALCALAVIGGAAFHHAPASSRTRDATEELRSTIAFSSTRDNPTSATPFVNGAEIYLMNADGTDVRRLTNNDASDIFPSLSPDGTKIIFESNRRRTAGDPPNVSDLFLMNTDGTDQTWLRRGSSGTWSPDGRSIAFHASASGTALPVNPYPGSATLDSDIFVVNMRDLLEKKATPRNITNNPAAVDDDPDWSPDGKTIIFTSHATDDNHTNAVTAEIYALSANGTGKPRALTRNHDEERAPAWSPDGKRILFCCRRGSKPDFDLCVMNADGSNEVKLTDSPLGDLTPSWSPDGSKIVFHRPKGRGLGLWDLWLISADGSGESRLTDASGYTGFAHWGMLRANR
jgi:TolB protein